MSDDRPAAFDDDNPERTAEDFARAKRPEELPPHILAAFPKTMVRGPGRPPAEKPKPRVTMRLDQDVLDHYRAMGRGWQTRINEVLRKASGI